MTGNVLNLRQFGRFFFADDDDANLARVALTACLPVAGGWQASEMAWRWERRHGELAIERRGGYPSETTAALSDLWRLSESSCEAGRSTDNHQGGPKPTSQIFARFCLVQQHDEKMVGPI